MERTDSKRIKKKEGEGEERKKISQLKCSKNKYELVLTALVYLAGRRKKQDDSTFEYRRAYIYIFFHI